MTKESRQRTALGSIISGAAGSSKHMATRVPILAMTNGTSSQSFPDNLRSWGKLWLVVQKRANPKLKRERGDKYYTIPPVVAFGIPKIKREAEDLLSSAIYVEIP